jgi:hypothetical protein
MRMLNLGFIMFAPQQDNDQAIMCEDGYGSKLPIALIFDFIKILTPIVLVRDGTWKAIRNAIQNSQDITIPLDHGKRFTLQWKRSVYHNPIDGGQYSASWRSYNPSSGPKPPSDSHVQMSQIVFLVEPPNGAVDTHELVAYTKSIIAIVEQQTPVNPLPVLPGNNHPGRQAVVEIELPKREGWLKMTAYPGLDGINVQAILGQVAALREPEARATTKFQLFFNLWGYQGPEAHFS